MPLTKTTPEAILRSSWSLFHEHGYKNTSLQQLAEAAGLGKAGLLHHFGSKEGLMHAVIHFAAEWYRSRVLSLADGEGTVAERLEAVLRKQFQLVQLNNGGGCFFANMILETGGGVFTEGLSRFHTEWIAAITALLSERFPAAEAAERAYRIFVDYEGSVMLYKLYEAPDHLERFIARAVGGLNNPLNA